MSLILLLPVACGFHLRGAADLPPFLSAVYIEEQQAPLIAEALKQAFVVRQLQPVEDKSQAQVVVDLRNELYNRKVLSVGTAGKVQEFELNYDVDLALLSPKGAALADAQKLSIRRELRYDSNEVLAKSSEEELLKKEMVEDAARQIIRRLQFIKTD
jgi:LPS-assembly lipoprotein